MDTLTNSLNDQEVPVLTITSKVFRGLQIEFYLLRFYEQNVPKILHYVFKLKIFLFLFYFHLRIADLKKRSCTDQLIRSESKLIFVCKIECHFRISANTDSVRQAKERSYP